MGHRQMINLYGDAESPLPLVDLSGIRRVDALGTPWPETDCIVGNPPFLGDRNLRGAFGDAYVNWLITTFGIGLKDFCVYWFRKTQDHLQPGQRAGLVGTNSIAQNRPAQHPWTTSWLAAESSLTRCPAKSGPAKPKFTYLSSTG